MAEPTAPKHFSLSKRKTRRLRLGLWLAVALVFAVQVAVLFWLGNPPAPAHPQPPAAPIVHLVGKNWQELLALEDPTFFILPHRQNFSGPVWITSTPEPFEPASPTEPARLLLLAPEALGSAFTAFMETNPPPAFKPDTGLEFSDLRNPGAAPVRAAPIPSSVRLEGDLSNRRLLMDLRLPVQTNSDVLKSTAVQVFVDALGNVFSPVIVSGSGNADVDQLALTNFAKNARFEPIKGAPPGAVLPRAMSFGKMVFEWQTAPPAPTNSAPPAS